MTRRPVIGAALLAAVVVGALVGRERIDFVAFEASLAGLGMWAPLGFAAAFAAGTVLFLPGAPFGLVGGALFGPVWGTVVSLGAATAGATLAFLLARYVASDWVARRVGGRARRLVDSVNAEGWRFVALARLVPVVPFNLLNYALGLTRIPVTHYVSATLVCMLPGTAAYTWLGYAGRHALAGDASAIRYGLVALGLLVAVALVPRLLRRFRTLPVTWTEPSGLERQRHTPEAPLIVDVRGRDEFDGPLGHIQGARNIPVDALPARMSDLNALRGRAVVVVCLTDKRSTKAAELLAADGFRQVSVLRGGMKAWHALSLPIERAS